MAGKSTRIFSVLFLILIFQVFTAISQTEEEMLPPHGVSINPVTLVVSWQSPGFVILSEDFEGGSFPPENWQTTSAGKGWELMDTILGDHWKIPAHAGAYALSNDDSAPVGNQGNMDYLVTPALDLTEHDSLILRFDSYFDGAYGQSASLEYSLNGGSWILLTKMDPSLEWQEEVVDLAEFSGPGGYSDIRFAFHSNDNGYNGSGWAIDNIEIANSLSVYLPQDYIVLYDGVPVDTTAELISFIPTIEYSYSDDHTAGVFARYPDGISDTVFIPYESLYLFPVYDLHTEYCGRQCIGLGWSGPYRPPDCWPWELISTIPTPDYYMTEGGCDYYDGYIYIVYENTNDIVKMDNEGNVEELFSIYGVPPLTDITHEYYHGYFYGVCGTNVVYKMDFETHTLISQFTAPAPLHAIAYSDQYERFWGNNISSDIIEFDQYQVYDSFPVGIYGNIHSLAYNDFTYEDACLYGFSRDSTGCLIVEYNTYEGAPTGFTKDISGLFPGGQAGGIFFDYYTFQPGCTTIGGTIQNELAFNYTFDEFHYPGWTPQGIWGYYIYKDDEVFDSIEIMCDRWLYWAWYPEDTLPQEHEFSVAVKYELDMFGLEGQTTFSEKDGPIPTTISYGHELDFEEKWSSNNFNFNKWDTTGHRWEVYDDGLGNPLPSACVRGISGAGPYSCTLQSYLFKPDSTASCGISLSYDIRVIDNFPSGNQTMQLDLWESGTRTWQKLKEYHNDTVWDGYFTENIDLSSKVKDRYFMFRFIAFGVNANDFQFWSIDNIRVKRSCPPPADLETEYNNEAEAISLDWTSYFPEINQWICHDDSIQNSSVGLDTGPDTWCDAAIRWDKFSLNEYYNGKIEQIAFIPSNPETHYILKVWAGDSARALKAEKAVSDLVIDEWNIIQLDVPVKIDIAQELWIGYSFSAKGNDPISLDAGPAIDSLGNLCRIGNGNWTTLSDLYPGIDGNINIRAFIHKPEQAPEGYRIYKSVDSSPYGFVAEVSADEYIDYDVTLNSVHCYKVQSVCTISADTISSSYCNESCTFPVNLNEIISDDPGITIFPNPAQDYINIHAPESISQIDIFDYSGRSVLTYQANSQRVMIDLISLSPGIYIVKVRSKTSTSFKKIIITE